MKTIAVVTSGGDAPGMNAAVRAVAKIGASRGVRVLGVLDGYEGLIDGRMRELTVAGLGATTVTADPELDFHGAMGGTILGSARSARFRGEAGRAQAARRLNGSGIDGLVVIGGNGSLTGAHLLAVEHGVHVIGIPASIDNDLGCTSTAIGVDSALNTIVEACDRISDTARAHHRAFVVEVMGRQSGYLAMAGAIAAGGDAVLIREQGRGEDEIVEAVATAIRNGFRVVGKQRVLVVKAEGVEMSCTRLVRRVEKRLAEDLAGVEIRATVLGHLVRGGRPSYQDRMISGRFGLAAVQALLEGASDEMVAWMPNATGGIATDDPWVQRFALEQVLRESDALLDGTSPVTKRRLRMMEAVEGVLTL
jgi:6-phosphofructokinase 1